MVRCARMAVLVGTPAGHEGSTDDRRFDTATRRRRAAELLHLARDADSIELKLTVPELAYRSTAAALGVDPLDAQIRQVFFFDTPELTLNEAGLVARARRIQGKDSDSVVKLRPVVPERAAAERAQVRRTSSSRSTPCPVATCAPAR